MQRVSSFILKIFGWKIVNQIPEGINKAVIIMAPHTSYYDFVMGRLGYWHLGMDSKFYIKKEAFIWPIGGLLKKLGGIPVDRRSKTNLVDTTAQLFNNSDTFFITITPEGTRAKVNHWKKGYYHLAIKAKVPIVLGYLDYKEKTGGPTKVFYPTGNYEEDFDKIKSFYQGISGKHPERFNLYKPALT